MALVAARLQYALPALAGQLSADDLRKGDAGFNKARRWQLTSRTPYSADLIEQSKSPLIPSTVCIAYFPQRRIRVVAIWWRKVMNASCHLQKLNCIKIVFNTFFIQIYLILIISYASRENIWLLLLSSQLQFDISYFQYFCWYGNILYLCNCVRLSY